MTLEIGNILQNRYRIDEVLGEGGFGKVYRAWDLNLNAACAIKEIVKDTAETRRMFERETALLFRLRHTNLPHVIDRFILEEQGLYLVMDFIAGEDLEKRLERTGGALPIRQALHWMLQVLDALQYMHSQDPPVIHRDIKPANIRITPQGQAVLVDFGISKTFDPELTRSIGGFAITPGYSPHEQYEGQADQRSDLYSLGATLYDLLTGQPPVSSLKRVVNDTLPPPRQLNPQIPPALEAVVLKAMQIDPARRYQSAEEMHKALELAGRPAPPKPVPLPSLLDRLRPYTWIGGLALLILVALTFWFVFGPGRPKPALPGNEATPVNTSEIAAPPASTDIPPPASTDIPPPASTEAKPPQPTDAPPLEPTDTPTPVPTDTSAPTVTPIPTQTPVPTLGIGSTMVSSKDGMTLVYVPEGEFQMGSSASDPQASDDEKPQHPVTLDAFWIDRTEVTNAMFSLFVQQTSHQTDAEKAGSGWAWTGTTWQEVKGADWRHPRGPNTSYAGVDHPVVQVSWNDATAYCSWAGRQLPSEAQWEKAARGTDGRLYPWGNAAPAGDLLNFADVNLAVSWADKNVNDGYQFTAPVGSYLRGASPYGALDMAGNVWEWVADWYAGDFYTSPAATSRNPTGPASGDYRVLRGGSWNNPSNNVRAAVRYYVTAELRYAGFGFRCALSPGK